MNTPNIDAERQSTYNQYSKARNDVKSINVSITDLELNLGRSSDNMKGKYKEVLQSKRNDLTVAEMNLDRHNKRLNYLNSDEGVAEFEGVAEVIPKNFPYANLSRKTLDDDTKVSIIKQYGRTAYLSMPV